MSLRRPGAILVMALVSAACTTSFTPASSSAPPSSASTTTASPSPSVEPPIPHGLTAAEAIKALCEAPTIPPGHVVEPGAVAPDVATLESQVSAVRGLAFRHEVAVRAVSRGELDRLVRDYSKGGFPSDLWKRRTASWSTMDLISPTLDLRDAIRRAQVGTVAGFYDPRMKALVYLSNGGELGVDERFYLAHELTHALDDQYYPLNRMDHLATSCNDEALDAAKGAIEGDAQLGAVEVITRYPTQPVDDIDALIDRLSSSFALPAENAPFLLEQTVFVYGDGLLFMKALEERGGTAARDAALRHLPVSTEQVIHPDKYPSDQPQTVNIPDLGPSLGPEWYDLDAMVVGEAFLRAAFRRWETTQAAASAAAGWDGGVYRAWTDGDRVAVDLRTVWDTQADAREFAHRASGQWMLGVDGSVHRSKDRVDLLFGSDADTLEALEKAAS